MFPPRPWPRGGWPTSAPPWASGCCGRQAPRVASGEGHPIYHEMIRSPNSRFGTLWEHSESYLVSHQGPSRSQQLGQPRVRKRTVPSRDFIPGLDKEVSFSMGQHGPHWAVFTPLFMSGHIYIYICIYIYIYRHTHRIISENFDQNFPKFRKLRARPFHRPGCLGG